MKKLICVLLALLVLFAFAACEAEKEPVRSPSADTTEGTEPKTDIFTVTILYSNEEESTNRMTSECDNLAAALMERNMLTEDMLTVGGEKADPAQGAYWTLYIDGVYATESWDKIPVEGGVEYMFEYTQDNSFGEILEEDSEGGIEVIPGETDEETFENEAPEDSTEEEF